MWDKKGEDLTYRFLRLLKEQFEDDEALARQEFSNIDSEEAQTQQQLDDVVLNATKKAPRCLKSNILAFGAGMGRLSNMADSVKKIQDVLGFTGGQLDGKFGKDTLNAVLQFQIKNKLDPDGCVGPQTLKALGIEIEPVVSPKRKVARFSGKMSDEIKERNMKYFGNPDGFSGNGWQSSLEDKRYNHRLNYMFGPIPYRGTTEGKPSNCELHPDWKKDNLKRVSTSIGKFTAHKQVADKMAAAIEECRQTYGLPLRLNGAYYKKGTSRGFSTHAWGCAVDLDSYILNPFTKDGNLSLAQTRAARAGKAGTRPYWQFKNSEGVTWKEYLDSLGPSEKAMPLYVFVAGPRNNNGMAKIFAKHGFPSWGGNWRGSKDNLHFSVFG